ncbi:MAG: glycoside hydrolase [Deltaproteobacteria bacterium HGW-Deltaproteobacteria-4]|nr:MAG: glycoside hydrolase [Deltaproteobacteria bacterium HGW-Deltaproteobacteria-4]
MERFLCIHGHFYQPPRENPWLEAIEIQDSAYPYHDWNERITAECYAPNTASRTLDHEGRIRGIINNYASISFNFGATLLSWMEKFAPATYQAILAADRQSRHWRSGHGAALAQVYNHIIMPLASRRDKETQVRWGIKDFEARFQRFPEGMWLAETAVDTETLEVLAAAEIRFTILAPHQAAAVRKIGSGKWQEVNGARIDPSQAYLCRLPSGRSITLFFYDGPISQAVAFEKLLSSGEQFAARLLTGFAAQRKHSQLVHIATDGETYGHHHRFGEMALGHALHHIKTNNLARLTNYGEYLELNPPTMEVQIVEKSSWSCSHGVERWRRHCGCNSGGGSGWNQQWRQPLREALDWLGGELADAYERGAAGVLKEPWKARDDYIDVILNRSPENVAAFLQRHMPPSLGEEAAVDALCLLEMQRHALLMFTSCGWFFDELSGLETVQIIQYAGRAIQLAGKYSSQPIEGPFLNRLALAKSNLRVHGDGAKIYKKSIKPAMIDLIKVGAHYAVSSVFEEYSKETGIFSYHTLREDFLLISAGEMRLAIGRVFIRSTITHQADRISFCTLYHGGHALNSGVRSFLGERAYLGMKREIVAAFNDGDVAKIIRRMDGHFGRHSYSLRNLFRDEQRQILKHIIAATLQEFEIKFSDLYDKSRSLAGFLRETGMPVPHRFMTTAETSLNLQLQKLFTAEAVDMTRLQETIDEIGIWKVGVDKVALEFIVRRRLERAMDALQEEPESPQRQTDVSQLLEAIAHLSIEVNLWEVQNQYWDLIRSRGIDFSPHAGETARPGTAGVEFLRKLGGLLHFNVGVDLTSRGEL